MTSGSDDMKIMVWILESIKVNQGYGLSRLLLRINEKYPGSDWNEGKLAYFMGRHDHTEGTKLLDEIAVDDNSKGRTPFQDPDQIIEIESIAKRLKKEISPGNEKRNNDSEFGGLTDSKHKIAYLLLKHFEVASVDYYSQGSTVTQRYWITLAEKLGIDLPRKKSKSGIVKLIFESCLIDFNSESDKFTSRGGTITKQTFITLCDHFGINIPANLVDEPDDEDDFHISLHSVNPIVEAKTISIEKLVNQFVGGRIYSPSFQRNFRWPIKKQRELIDSILLGIPLPSILLIRANDGDWWLVDGRQRVTSLRRYIKPKNSRNSFHLGSREGETSMYTNKYFSELGESVQNRILSTDVPVTYIEGLADHKSAIYELFRRYNTGGTNLNGAEIRHAVFHENNVHRELFKLVGEDIDVSEFSRETKEIRSLIRIGNKNTTGFKAYDRVCRYFGFKYGKGGSAANSMFKFFEDRSNSTIEDAKRFKDEFIQCVNFSSELYGDNLRFRRLKEGRVSGSFGAWPYTVQMMGAAHLIERFPDSMDLIEKRKFQIRDKWKDFYMNEIFNVRQNSTTFLDTQTKWCIILDQILGAGDVQKSEYEFMIKELYDTEKSLRRKIIEGLKGKVYYEKLVKKALFEGWI